MPASTAAETVLGVLAQHAQRPPRTLQDSDALVDLGIDSLRFVVAILEIEQLLQQQMFNAENVGALHTVGDILRLVERRSATDL